MRLKYLICCESSAFDLFSNRVSLFHIIDQVTAPAYPIALTSLAIVFCLERDNGDPDAVNARVSISYGAQELASYPMAVQFGGNPLARGSGNVQGFFVPGPGRLTVSLNVDEQIIGTWDIDCSQVGEFQFQQTPPSTPAPPEVS
jgi:hypothetical protein